MQINSPPKTPLEFLESIFYPTPENSEVAITGFTEDPINQKDWSPSIATDDSINNLLSPENNGYFGISTLHPEQNGSFKASQANVAATHVLMVDDLGDGSGSKGSLDGLNLEPTYVVETSPNNYQAGYVLKTPITDKTIAKLLTNQLAEKCGGDEGAKNYVRWARLPFCTNTKQRVIDEVGHPFITKLTQWNPECKYTYQELADAYDISLTGKTPDRAKKVRNKKTPKAASSKGKFFTVSNDISDVSTEEMSEEEVLKKLFNASNGQENLKLFNGDTSKYNGDHSSADLAFVNSIAFYTQQPEQIDSIFRQSKLMRDKWDVKHSAVGETYGEMTINKALENLNDTYSAPKPRQSSSKQKSSSRAFRLISGKDIIDRPIKTDWLIEDFIPADSTALIFGEPASGKSLIALEMACCIASGDDWYGHPVKQGNIAYIAGEGFHGLSKRLNALVQEKKLSVDHLHCSESSMDLMHSESVDEVMNVVENIENLGLIIIDTLHRNFTGDESSSKDFAIVLKHCDQLRLATSATIMLVHHSGHKSSGRARGSSSIKGAIDAEFKVSQTNRVITMDCNKMKDDEKPKDIKFDLKPVTIGEDENGKAITAPLLQKSTTFCTADRSSLTLNHTDRLTLDTLTQLNTENNDPASKADWKATCMDEYSVTSTDDKAHQAKSKKFSRSLRSLLEKGVVVDDNGCFTVAGTDATTGKDDE